MAFTWLTGFTIDGKVGIGTNNPGGELEVNGTIRVGNSSGGVFIRESGLKGEILGLNNTGTSYVDLSIRSASGTQLYLDTSGNVGIGTTSPSGASGKTLAINGGTGQARLAFKNNSTGDASGDGLQISLDATLGAIEMRENLPLVLTTNNTERIRVNAAGNVSIGNTNDTYKLDVSGTGRFTGLVTGGGIPRFLQNIVSSGDNYINFTSGVKNANIGYNDGIGIFNVIDGQPLQVLFNNGNFSIGNGTTDNGYKLDVNGTGRFTGQLTIPLTPSATTDAASKAYVDAHPAGTVTGTGTTNTFPIWTNTTGTLGDSILTQSSTQRIQITSGSATMILGQWDGVNNRIESASRPLRITTYTGNIMLGISGSTHFAVGTYGTTTTGVSQVGNLNNTDTYFVEGLRTGTGVTYRVYDNGTNVYTDGYKSLNFRANQNGGSGGFIGLWGGFVGVNSSLPGYWLDVNGATKTLGFLNTNGFTQKMHGIYFPNAVASQAVDIKLSNINFWGSIEVEITGAYSNQNTAGKLTKIFSIGTVLDGTIYENTSRISEAMGQVVNNIRIGDFVWDATVSQYVIPIYHIVSSGNPFVIKITAFSYASGAKGIFDSTTLSAVYTQVSPVLTPQYPYYSDRLGVGIADPTYKLDVAGKIRCKDKVLINGVDFDMASVESTAGHEIARVDTQDGVFDYANQTLTINSTGYVTLESYDAANFTGTPTYLLGTDASGNVVKTLGAGIPGGPYLPLTAGSGFPLTAILYGTSANFSATGQFGEMVTIDITDINTGENRGLKLLNSNGVDQQWNITAGTTGVDNDNFTIRDATNNRNALIINVAGNTTLAGTLAVSGAGDSYFTGDLGIGVTSPAYPLDVNGNAKVNGTLYFSSDNISYISGTNSLRASGQLESVGKFRTYSDLIADGTLAVSGTGDSYFTGNVGIGTTSPSAKLHVEGESGSIYVQSTTNNQNASVSFNSKIGTTQLLKWEIGTNINTGADFEIYDRVANSTRFLVEEGTGNVGIGTTGPSEKLDVLGRIRSSFNSGDYTEMGSSDSGGFLGMFSGGVEKILFRTYGDSYFNGGNVGIGVTSPTYKLDVNGVIRLQSSNQIYFGGTGSIPYWKVGVQNTTTNNFEIAGVGYYSGDRDILLTPVNNGNVGIGNTTPSYKLDVSGTIRATGDVIAYSDARVKDNVEIIKNALDKVTQLRGVSYTRNDVEDKTTKIGVIAQEVLEVLPEVVQQDDEGKYSVAYGNMVGLLIEAIKEQDKKIERLEGLVELMLKNK